MAVTRCTKCSRLFSGNLDFCPNCGHPNTQKGSPVEDDDTKIVGSNPPCQDNTAAPQQQPAPTPRQDYTPQQNSTPEQPIYYIEHQKKTPVIWIVVVVLLLVIIGFLIFFVFKSDSPRTGGSIAEQTEAVTDSTSTQNPATDRVSAPDANPTTQDAAAPAEDQPVVEAQSVEHALSLRPVNTSELNRITLSSQYGNSYGLSNLFDGENATAWVIGADAYFTNMEGMDPVIKFATNGQTPTKLLIKNGYNKSSKSYNDNSRVGRIVVKAVGGPGGSKVLYDGWLRDTPNLQTINLPEQPDPYSTLEVRVSTEEIYEGSKYWDICINEISFRGK